MKDPKISIQEYLSLGYVFLVVLGIISDTIYYKFLGLNILSYSSILDILISPISLLTSNIIMLIAVIILVAFGYLMIFKINPWYHKRNRNKTWYRRMAKDIDKLDKQYESPPSFNQIIKLMAVFLISMYLGVGTGRGSKMSSRMSNGAIEPDYILYFGSEDRYEIEVVGQNSLYLFYVAKGEDFITIAPIEGNIKKIRKMDIKENE